LSRVAIIHPWFPQYRREFFDQLRDRCSQSGLTLDVFVGEVPPEWKERGDEVDAHDVQRLPTRFIRVGGRSLAVKSLKRVEKADYDLIIVEHAIRNLETYRLLLDPRTRRKVAWWGHGQTYTAEKPAHEERLKARLVKRGAWYFAYTGGGAKAVRQAGFPADRITVVNNSTDSRALADAVSRIDSSHLKKFKHDHDLGNDNILFIGGLDESKRIPFLLDATKRAWERNNKIRLLVVGDGPAREQVSRFADHHEWCIPLGRLFGADRATVFRAAQIMAIPGRVGLAAVDSFASGTPIVTTKSTLHAPEFEYLSDGENAVVSDDTVDDYAVALGELLGDRQLLARLTAGCADAAPNYTVEAMVERFHDGVLEALEAGGS